MLTARVIFIVQAKVLSTKDLGRVPQNSAFRADSCPKEPSGASSCLKRATLGIFLYRIRVAVAHRRDAAISGNARLMVSQTGVLLAAVCRRAFSSRENSTELSDRESLIFCASLLRRFLS